MNVCGGWKQDGLTIERQHGNRMQESAFEVCNYEDLAALIRWLSVMWFVPYPSGIAITDPIGSSAVIADRHATCRLPQIAAIRQG